MSGGLINANYKEILVIENAVLQHVIEEYCSTVYTLFLSVERHVQKNLYYTLEFFLRILMISNQVSYRQCLCFCKSVIP